MKQNLRTDCKCHGMSGSCSLKTCWKTLPYFKIVSNYLMEKYWKANGVTVAPVSVSQSRNVLNISLTKPHSKRSPTNNELVFLEQSPNYCEKDTHLGSLGTVGRICNRSSTGKYFIYRDLMLFVLLNTYLFTHIICFKFSFKLHNLLLFFIHRDGWVRFAVLWKRIQHSPVY